VAAAPFLYIQAAAPAWLEALIFLPVIVGLAYELWQAHLRRRLHIDFSHGSVVFPTRAAKSDQRVRKEL
jgi:hypothetical protein